MHDLLYFSEDRQEMERIQKLILEKWPQAKLEESWDDVHEHRLGVEIEELSEKEWFGFVFYRRLVGLSLTMALRMRDGDKQGELRGALDEWKAAGKPMEAAV